jgi:hypothetical protein
MPKQLDPIAFVDAHVRGRAVLGQGRVTVRRQGRPGTLSLCSRHGCRAPADVAPPRAPLPPRLPKVEGLKKQRRQAAMELLNKRHGRMGKGSGGAAAAATEGPGAGGGSS